MDFLLAFATAVAAPDDRGGIAVAARHALQDLDAAQDLFPSPRLAAARAEIAMLVTSLESQLEAAPGLGLVSERERKLPVYGLFVNPPILTGQLEAARRLTAVAGMALAVALSRLEEIRGSYAEAFSKVCKAYVRKRGLHQDWYVAAEALTRDGADLRRTAESCSSDQVRRFLLATLDLHESTLKPQAGPADAAAAPTAQEETPALAPGAFPAENGESSDELAEPVAPNSEPVDILKWQLGRAEFSRFGDTMGLSSVYGRLPPACLAPITAAIAGALRGVSFDREYPLFAIYSLVFNLPPEKLLCVQVATHGTVSLDPRGYFHWEMAPAFGANARPVYVPLPAVAVRRQLQLLSERPHVATIDELCAVPDEEEARKEWLSGYDAFLKSIGDSAYPAWPSRFANSLPQVYLEVSGRDALTATCTMNFAIVPAAMLHYPQLPASLIGETASAVYRATGLGEHIGMPDGYVGAGAPDVPDIEKLRAGWSTLVNEAEQAFHALITADTPEALVSAWNELCRLNALMFCLLTAHRGQRIERCTFGALTASTEYVFLSDKDVVNGGSARLIPKTTLLSQTIDWHLGCLALLARKVAEVVDPTNTIAEFRRLGVPYNKAAFFRLRWNARERRFARSAITPAALTEVADRLWGARANAGRKFWVTQLVLRGVDWFCIRLLTLHRRQGAEPDHPVQWQVPKAALATLRDAMEAILSEADLAAPNQRLAAADDLPMREFPLPRAAKGGEAASAGALAVARGPGGFTLSAISVVGAVRALLAKGMRPTDPQSALALACVVFDGITSLRSVRGVACNTRDSLVRIGKVAFLQAQCGDNSFAYPLQSVTHELLLSVLATMSPRPWKDVIAEASNWLRDHVQGFSWGKDAFGQLLQAEGHWLQLFLPAMLNSAADSAAAIGAMSLRSCLRLAGAATSVGRTESATERPHVSSIAACSLASVSPTVHRWGSRNKNLGGDIERAKGLEEALAMIAVGDPGSPSASVHAWARYEATALLSRSADVIQPSTLSTYLSNLAAALASLSPLEDLRTWGDEHWRDFHRLIGRLAGEDSDAPGASDRLPKADRDPAFFRFARALAQVGGYSIPPWILAPTPRRQRLAGKSAASVWIGMEHFEAAQRTLERWLSDEPLIFKRATVLLRQLEETPCRISELTTLFANCLTDDSHVVLRPNGFSILKTTTSKRVLQASDQLSASVRELASFSQDVRPGSQFLFLDDNKTTQGAAEVVHLARSALEEAVGDSDLVLHSTRASSMMRTIAPGWDGVVQQVFRQEAGPMGAASLFVYEQRKWQLPALAASRAGHSERRTLIDSYGAAWTLLRYLALAGTLVDLRIGAPLLQSAGVSSDALRQARSRAQREGSVFDEWLWWCKRLPALDIPECGAQETAASQRLGATAHANAVPDAPPPAPLKLFPRLRYVAKRHLGIDIDVAAAGERIGFREAQRLERAVERTRGFSDLTKRVRSAATLRGRAADLKSLDLPQVVTWLAECDAFDPKRVDGLWALLKGEIRPDARDSAAYVKRVADALQVLPADTTLELTFGQRHHNGELAAKLELAGAVVGQPHRDFGAVPRVFVVRCGRSKNDVEKARLTSVVRLLVCAFICVKEGC